MDPIIYVKNYYDEKINIRPLIHKLPTKEVIICRMAIGEMEPYDQLTTILHKMCTDRERGEECIQLRIISKDQATVLYIGIEMTFIT